MGESLVIEVRPHVMRDGNDVRSEILEMAIERRRLFEELEFDHVTVMAVVCFVSLFCSLFICRRSFGCVCFSFRRFCVRRHRRCCCCLFFRRVYAGEIYI